MNRIRVPIYFDYASTLCYIAWRIVGELEAELGFEALWKGVPISRRDLSARAGRVVSRSERQKILLVAAETGVLVAPPEKWTDSSLALQGSELAREVGAFRAYHDAVFRALFERHRDIADIAMLTSIAGDTGMDAKRFRADLDAARMSKVLEAHQREADSFSAFGYPTFILGDFTLTGIQPKESMRLVISRYLRQRTTEPRA
ncbi:MAG: DsbA family oxidoreductase [Candidatus Binataceae bacterium]